MSTGYTEVITTTFDVSHSKPDLRAVKNPSDNTGMFVCSITSL